MVLSEVTKAPIPPIKMAVLAEAELVIRTTNPQVAGVIPAEVEVAMTVPVKFMVETDLEVVAVPSTAGPTRAIRRGRTPVTARLPSLG